MYIYTRNTGWIYTRVVGLDILNVGIKLNERRWWRLHYKSIVDEFVPHGSLDMPHIDHADWQVHSSHHRYRRRRHRPTTGTCAHGQDTYRRRGPWPVKGWRELDIFMRF